MEVPLWAVAVFGTGATFLVGIIGFFMKSTLASLAKRADASELEARKIRAELSVVDKRFLEEQLAQTKAFVDKEGFTRDYVTLTGRIDGLHKRVDRVERTPDPRQPRKRPDTDPPVR